jgi:ribosome maturation factor RimP
VGRDAHFFVVRRERFWLHIYMTNNELEDIIAPELETLGFECVKCEVVGSSRHPVVRLYIDKPGGVSITDCSLVSRSISLLLDREDPFPGKYLLEVSSPGSDRPLTTEAHFKRFEGEPARVEIAGADTGRITYTGHIRSCINGLLTMETADGEVILELSRIKKAHLIEQEYKIDKKMKRPKRDKSAKKRKGDQK